MLTNRAQFILTVLVTAMMIFPGIPAAAAQPRALIQTQAGNNVLSDGQFVYGPNVGDFDLKTYLKDNAPHLLPYADDLYGRSKYYSINPKIYLTLLEVHSHLISIPNPALMNDPFGLKNGDFNSQIDLLSDKMSEAYYRHIYSYSALPISQRNMEPFVTPSGVTISAAADTNAGTYALLAGLVAIDEADISAVLDNNQAGGFYQTYLRLFANDDPLDETNHIYIPGEVGALSAPDSLLQFPWLQGQSWFFSGVHSNGSGGAGTPYVNAAAMDFSPGGIAWGSDTSNMWVVATAAGVPTKTANCGFSILHSDGWETGYYHIENIQSFSGTINQNDKIGVIANTLAEATCAGGNASGPHVHFWLSHNGALTAINGTPLSGWYIHAGRWEYDTDQNYMWLEKSGVKQYANINRMLSEIPPFNFKSAGKNDGWLLESTETSNKGGSKNATATLNLGDNAANKQYRSILSFDSASLPDTINITKVTLRLKSAGVTGGGNPVTAFKGIMVEIRKGAFGTSALEIGNFQSAPSHAAYGPFNPTASGGWYSIGLTSAKSYINKLGLTQIRLKFKMDDNNNGIANLLKLYSGNTTNTASRPQLIIEYSVP